MAFRTSVARQFPFNVHLGRIQGQLIGGDDTELIERVTQAGLDGVWVPGARAKHFIPRERLTYSYVQKWYRDAGRNLVRRGSLGPCPSLWGAPRWAVVQYNMELARSFLLSPGKGRRWLRAFTQAARLKGLIEESRELKRNDKNPTPNVCSAAQ
jgi:hypothetical protein